MRIEAFAEIRRLNRPAGARLLRGMQMRFGLRVAHSPVPPDDVDRRRSLSGGDAYFN